MKVRGKSVFILGAGASHHTGAPLLHDFMDTAEWLLRGVRDLPHRDKFQLVFNWLREIRGTFASSSTDLRNLENVFSLLQVQVEADLDQAQPRYDALLYVICETLSQQIRINSIDGISRDRVAYEFYTKLVENDAERKSSTSESFFSPDSLISFNYDLVMDHAMYMVDGGRSPIYGIETGKKFGRSLLKPHGSMNWVYHPRCSRSSKEKFWYEVVPPTTFEEAGQSGKYWLCPTLRQLQSSHKCGACLEVNRCMPLIIPPTWAKAARYIPMQAVWKLAIKEISEAEQLVIIGYSMPDTDSFFRYLLASGISLHSNLQRVIIVNPSSDVAHRFKRILPKSVRIFYFNRTFEELVPNMASLYETERLDNSEFIGQLAGE